MRDDSGSGRIVSRLTFVVLGDGRELWKSAKVDPGRPQPCRVRVKGVETLELRVLCPGVWDYAFAVWIDPVLLN